MAAQSEIEANKAVADAFYQAGVEGKLTSFARYLAPDFEPQALLDKLGVAHELKS